MELRTKSTWFLLFIALHSVTQITGEGLRLPDQQTASAPQQQVSQNVQHIFQQQQQVHPQQQQQQQQQYQQQLLQQQQQQAGAGEGRSSILSLFGLGQDNDPYLSRVNSNCLGGDLSECFKTQALSSFDEIFFKNQYRLSDFARVVRMPESQQRTLQQEPFEYSEEPRNEDTDWDQLLKYALRRAERFIKSTALEVELPEELTEAGRYQARFISNDIDSELDIIEDKHAPTFSRKKLKKMIIPLLLVLKIFKLKLLLFLPFILGIAGLKKILGLAAIILPGLFAYFKLCRPPGAGVPGFGAGAFGGLFGAKAPEYSPQGVGAANYYHHHEHYEGGHGGGGGGGGGPFYRQEPTFSKPYTDYYSKNYQNVAGNAVSFGEPQEAAYSGYSQQYGRSSGKDVPSTQKS